MTITLHKWRKTSMTITLHKKRKIIQSITLHKGRKINMTFNLKRRNICMTIRIPQHKRKKIQKIATMAFAKMAKEEVSKRKT